MIFKTFHYRKALLPLMTISMVVLTIHISACSPHGQPIFPDTNPVVAADPNSPYKHALETCVYSTTRDQPCTFGELPYIGQDTNGTTPTVDDILRHTAVTEPWMAQRFREVLMALPKNVRQLAKPVTAFVIANDLTSPGFFPYTGAIYIHAKDLWVTQAERNTMNLANDDRGPTKGQLQLSIHWRYTLNQVMVSPLSNLATTGDRNIDEIKYQLAAILFHETGHAADFTTTTPVTTVSKTQTPYDVYLQNRGRQASDTASAQFPLHPSIFSQAINSVIYGTNMPTPEQLALSPSQAADMFKNEPATDPYAYTDPTEDTAVIFEEFMMLSSLGIQRDIAITSNPPPPASANNFIVAWGQRKRIADPVVREKVKFIVSKLFPEWATPEHFALLDQPTPLPPGKGWVDDLSI